MALNAYSMELTPNVYKGEHDATAGMRIGIGPAAREPRRVREERNNRHTMA